MTAKGPNPTAVYRAALAGFAKMDTPIEVRGQKITGAALATMLAVDPELAGVQAWRTPQIISEIGRILAAATYEKDIAELRYRVWRDGEIHKIITDLDYAIKIGAVGDDAKKTLARDNAETFTRTLDEYTEHYEKVIAATEAVNAIAAAYEAAKARIEAERSFVRTQGSSPPSREHFATDGTTDYDGQPDERSLSEREDDYARGSTQLTPLPNPRDVPVGPPPPNMAHIPPPPPVRS